MDSILEAETLAAGAYGEAGMPVAGEGAPLVAEFSVTEFAAALGMSTDAGKRYVGHALELRYRLPRVWRRVQSGDLRPWLARRIAEKTLLLTQDAAGFVDRHVAPTAHRIGPGPAGPAGGRGDRPVHARPKPRPGVANGRMAGTSPSSPGR